MKTLPPEISDAERVVHHYKGKLLIHVMAAILRVAIKKEHVYPGDLPEDIVAPEHKQGVSSNAWNALKSLEIIEPLPLTFTNATLEIYAGQKKMPTDTHPKAKGSRVSVYKLISYAKAVTWAERNEVELQPKPKAPMVRAEQRQLL